MRLLGCSCLNFSSRTVLQSLWWEWALLSWRGF